MKSCLSLQPSHGSLIWRSTPWRQQCILFNEGILQVPLQPCTNQYLSNCPLWRHAPAFGPRTAALFNFHAQQDVKLGPWPVLWEGTLGPSAFLGCGWRYARAFRPHWRLERRTVEASAPTEVPFSFLYITTFLNSVVFKVCSGHQPSLELWAQTSKEYWLFSIKCIVDEPLHFASPQASVYSSVMMVRLGL